MVTNSSWGQAMRGEVRSIIARLSQATTPIAEVWEQVDHKSILVRANALQAIARRVNEVSEEDVIDQLVRSATAHENRTSMLMGTISVAHVAVACLLRIGSEEAVTFAQHLIDEWPEPDRRDLIWYLKSESLL
jgi:peptidyl-tRNA hydrolase